MQTGDALNQQQTALRKCLGSERHPEVDEHLGPLHVVDTLSYNELSHVWRFKEDIVVDE